MLPGCLVIMLVAQAAQAQVGDEDAFLHHGSHLAAPPMTSWGDAFSEDASEYESDRSIPAFDAPARRYIMVDGGRLAIPERVFSLTREHCPLPAHLPFWRKGIAYLAQALALTPNEKRVIYQFLPAVVQRILQPKIGI
jgi:hypothetical protein